MSQAAPSPQRLDTPVPLRFMHPSGQSVEWVISDAWVDYAAAVAQMEAHVQAMIAGQAAERVWLLQHPPLYTSGTSSDVTQAEGAPFPVYASGRGGQLTYHGPGQRIAYVMLDLRARGQDLRRFIAALEGWIITTLAQMNIKGERREDRVGVWVKRPDKGSNHEDKIAAMGIRVRQWVTFHGMSINIDPDLSHFDNIVPCGVENPCFGVTSLCDLGHLVLMSEVDSLLRTEFEAIFGPTRLLAEGLTNV